MQLSGRDLVTLLESASLERRTSPDLEKMKAAWAVRLIGSSGEMVGRFKGNLGRLRLGQFRWVRTLLRRTTRSHDWKGYDLAY